jgi:adenylate cyclase
LAINYSLLAGVPVLDFEDVTTGKTDPALIKNRIVILGLLSTFDDVHETAIGTRPGMLIHATTIETLLSGETIDHLSKPVSLLLLALLSLLSYPLSTSRSPLRSILFLAIFSAVYSIASFALFAQGIVIPIFPHAAVPLIMFCITYPYRYVIEERGKRKLYQAFSYYVSPEVIDSLITSDADRLMKGERHNVCIMFLDIRGFTALSEKHESESIVSMLNTFFEQVTEIVQNNGGFVDKFIGDGVLAIFTVGEEYVDDAIEAAIKICQAVTEINSSGILKQHIGDDPLAIGIGLHAGTVILGNIGSKRKMDFTVIGRPVNAASRIESLTKEYSRAILMSSEVTSMSRRGFNFEPLGRAQVKGISGGVEIFGLLQ